MKIFFPLNCNDPLGIHITTNFGEPYPGQTKFNYREINIIKDVVNEINKFSQQNPNISLSTIEKRLIFLQTVATDRTGAFSKLKEKLNSYVSSFRNISFHPGIDINIGSGSQDANKPVYAVTNGRVLAMGNFCSNNCGQYIFIEHFCGGKLFYALYGHVSSLVRHGQVIRGGQQIATIAPITVFSPHLHFEVTLYSNTRPGKDFTYIRQVSNMPYTEYVLNLVYVAAVIYSQVLSNQTTFNIDRKYWSLVLVPRNNPWNLSINDSSSVYVPGAITNSIFYKNYGYVDPIKFLTYYSENNKFYNPVTENVCISAAVYSNLGYVIFTS